MHRTQIYLESAQVAALDARAKALGVTRSDLIRDLIDKGLVANDATPSLYEAAVRLAAAGGGMTQAQLAEQRAAFDHEMAEREARWRRQRRGEGD